MRLLILLSIMITCAQQSLAQVNNRSETDCNTMSETIYGVLGSGKVLLVVSSGFDCSICQSEAPAVNTFANQNLAGIRLWGAMNNKYSTATPTCTQLSTWKSSYNWSNLFSFTDVADYWSGGGFPYYTVINPADSEIYWQGFTFNTAKTKAMEISQGAGTSSGNRPEKETFKIYSDASAGNLSIQSPFEGNQVLKIFDLQGRLLLQESFYTELGKWYSVKPNLPLAHAVYLIRLESGQGISWSRFSW